MAQFLLELPSFCDDQKVSVKIENSGDAAATSRPFDLNLLMYQLAAYKPDFVFKQVKLEGNFDAYMDRFAEGIDMLFTKASQLYLSNLKMRAL